jgi:hypothetical protein
MSRSTFSSDHGDRRSTNRPMRNQAEHDQCSWMESNRTQTGCRRCPAAMTGTVNGRDQRTAGGMNRRYMISIDQGNYRLDQRTPRIDPDERRGVR